LLGLAEIEPDIKVGRCNRILETLNTCYVSVILTVGSEPVISFFK